MAMLAEKRASGVGLLRVLFVLIVCIKGEN